ncbi:hypothetical protein OQA88_8400 [Cercophora sp. LCS_1]
MATTRPYTALLALTFGILAAAATWKMRIQPATEKLAAGLGEGVWERQAHVNGAPLRMVYTGFPPADSILAFLVAAFMPGIAGWDERFLIQQTYFLPQFFSVISVLAVEAHRRRNDRRILGFTNAFALIYQMIGGAIIVPLWFILYVLASSRSDYHLPSNRQVRPSEARALLPALVVGYVVPTVLMYYPWQDRTDIPRLEVLNAIWQVSPLVPNLLVRLFASRDDTAPSVEQRKSAHKYVLSVHVVSGLFCAASHAWFVYSVLTSMNPNVSFASVLIPGGVSDAKADDASGLLWIFQWDLWGIFVSGLLWSFVGGVDVLRVEGAALSAGRVLKWTFWIGALSFIAGPGAAISAAWYWIESSMFGLEERKRGKQ